MMSEKEKIEKIIKENQPLLSARNIDFCNSIYEGDWFIFRHNKQYNYYEYFIKFSTAAQLIEIITEELRFEMNCCAGEEVSAPACEDPFLAEQIIQYRKSSFSL